MLTQMQYCQLGNQLFVTNVQQEAYSVSYGATRSYCHHLQTNADEGDLRIWLHCMHSAGTRILIYSPDTDVYHIRLTKVSEMAGLQIVVQLSKPYDQGCPDK